MISIILTDLSSDFVDKVDIENVENRHNFSYIDNQDDMCEMSIFDDGLCLFKKTKDHELKLNLRTESFAEIVTAEGVIKLDAKVVDFNENNDILVMRYLIEENEREIRIEYRS